VSPDKLFLRTKITIKFSEYYPLFQMFFKMIQLYI